MGHEVALRGPLLLVHRRAEMKTIVVCGQQFGRGHMLPERTPVPGVLSGRCRMPAKDDFRRARWP